MSAEIKTTNLGLNKWQGNERPQRQDFVTDNEAVDLAFSPTVGDEVTPGGHTHNGEPGKGPRISYFDVTNKPEKMEAYNHKEKHAIGGEDYISPASIGAASLQDLENTIGDMTNQNLNIIGLALEVEVLKGAAITGVTANIFIENFYSLADIQLSNGVYDEGNRWVWLP